MRYRDRIKQKRQLLTRQGIRDLIRESLSKQLTGLFLKYVDSQEKDAVLGG